MIGKIFIINKKYSTGKIVFSDGRESNIIEFPKTFDHDDNVDVTFAKDDISQKPIRMVAYTEEHYGFVMKSFANGGNILVTYPKILGLIKFRGNKFLDQSHTRVKFKIKKTDNRSEAIDIKENDNKKEFYKSKTPKFGKLEIHTVTPKEGFVSDIIKTKICKNCLSGVIKFIKRDKGFGFISCENNKDVYFKISSYKRFYEKEPQERDLVNFKIFKSSRGLQVTYFYDDKQFLPKNEQYGIVDEKRFLLKDFYKFYQQEAQIGDIIYYLVEDNSIRFLNTQQESKNIIFKQANREKKQNIKKGEIKALKSDKNFGFISVNNSKDVFFKINLYKKTYKKEPQRGDKVSFVVEKTEKGLQVKEFVKSNSNIQVLDKAFKNFTQIEPNGLYYAYIQDGVAKEVYQYDSNDLFQSISCYTDRTTQKKFKLLAIDCLIKNNYTNKNISLEKLKAEKNGLLNNFVDESIKNGDFNKALDYEYILQTINYNPKRLSKISKLLNKIYLIEQSKDLKLIDVKHDEKIEIISKKTEIKNLRNTESYNIDLNSYDIKNIDESNQKWDVDLNRHQTKYIPFDERWKIKLKD